MNKRIEAPAADKGGWRRGSPWQCRRVGSCGWLAVPAPEDTPRVAATVSWYVEELVLGDAWMLILLAEEPLDGTTAVHRGGRRAPLWVFVPCQSQCQCTAAARTPSVRSMHSMTTLQYTYMSPGPT